MMAAIFKLLKSRAESGGEVSECRIGLDIRLAGSEIDCPVSGPCRSVKEMERDVDALKRELDQLVGEAGIFFGKTGPAGGPEFPPHMTAEEIWAVLSGMSDDEGFAASFNGLEEDRRRAVAEHVLTRCNIFSGRASVFSARFDSETALIQ